MAAIENTDTSSMIRDVYIIIITGNLDREEMCWFWLLMPKLIVYINIIACLV